jgi:hypothetical protein
MLNIDERNMIEMEVNGTNNCIVHYMGWSYFNVPILSKKEVSEYLYEKEISIDKTRSRKIKDWFETKIYEELKNDIYENKKGYLHLLKFYTWYRYYYFQKQTDQDNLNHKYRILQQFQLYMELLDSYSYFYKAMDFFGNSHHNMADLEFRGYKAFIDGFKKNHKIDDSRYLNAYETCKTIFECVFLGKDLKFEDEKNGICKKMMFELKSMTLNFNFRNNIPILLKTIDDNSFSFNNVSEDKYMLYIRNFCGEMGRGKESESIFNKWMTLGPLLEEIGKGDLRKFCEKELEKKKG